MSFICNNSFTYVLRIIILNVTERQSEIKREGITTASRMYRPKEKKKSNQEPLAVAHLLFLTSNLLLPSNVYIYIIWLFHNDLLYYKET